MCNLFQAEAPLAEVLFFSHQESPGEIPISFWISLFQQSDTVRAKGVSLDCLHFFQAYGCGRRLQPSSLHSSRNGTGQVYTGSYIFFLDLNSLLFFEGQRVTRPSLIPISWSKESSSGASLTVTLLLQKVTVSWTVIYCTQM